MKGSLSSGPPWRPPTCSPPGAEDGYIAVDRDMATSVPGVFAAGDCTGQPLQIAKAVGEGQVAGHRAAEYLDRLDRAQK